MFYPEASPWTKETIRDRNQTSQARFLTNDVVTSQRVQEKMKTVGVKASIGASILGGLVKVTGSASYFNDLVVQDNEVKYPIQYLNYTSSTMISAEHRTYEKITALLRNPSLKHGSGLSR